MVRKNKRYLLCIKFRLNRKNHKNDSSIPFSMKNLRKPAFLAYLVFFFQVSCKKDIMIPALVTSQVTSISTSSAITGGSITSDGGASVTSRGVAYGTVQNPSIGNSFTSNGQGIGNFNSTITGLTQSTTYNVRAYATNTNGTGYGNELIFITLAPQSCPGTPTVTDIDNNTYNTVLIGDQCWTQSNLKTSRYQNGDYIPTGLTDNAWLTTTTGAYVIFDNYPVNDGLYGRLYNNYAVKDSRGLCPMGWHVPTIMEWTTLQNHLGGEMVAGGALKSTDIQPTPGGWNSPNRGATNSSGFTALPGGRRVNQGYFTDRSNLGYWWSSSASSEFYAWFWNLYWDGSYFYYRSDLRTNGFSVRCLKN